MEQINLMDIEPEKLTPELLDKLADHLMSKALSSVNLGGKPGSSCGSSQAERSRRKSDGGIGSGSVGSNPVEAGLKDSALWTHPAQNSKPFLERRHGFVRV